jgi:hypothetical protein
VAFVTPTAPVAALALVLGFAVAEITGVRALGGLVVAAGLGWCVLRWRTRIGWGRTVGLAVLFLLAFVGAHILAGPIGAWPAVLAVAAGTFVVVLAVDRDRSRTGALTE